MHYLGASCLESAERWSARNGWGGSGGWESRFSSGGVCDRQCRSCSGDGGSIGEGDVNGESTCQLSVEWDCKPANCVMGGSL